MSVPATKVEIGLTLVGIGLGLTPFTLDSATDGILGEDKIAGLEFFDITEYVKNVTVNRGRSRQFDYFNAGSAVVVLDNRDRRFDPINVSSPYYPEIRPRRLVRISTGDTEIFNGFINDWDIQYGLVGNDIATIYCADMFAILANMNLNAVTPSSQLTGARVNYILSRPEVNYIGGRDVDTGLTNVGAYAIAAETNVLNYLRQIERSEQGALFVSSNGNMTFKQRNSFGENVLSFSDDGSGIPYSSLSNEFGDELLYNLVKVQSPAGSAITKSDVNSIADYQVSELSYLDLLNSSLTDLDNLASFILNTFAEPQLRFTNLSVQLTGISNDEIDDVLSIELADFVNLTKTFATGSPSSYTQFLFVAGVSHQITPDSHRVTFNVESNGSYTILILGDSNFGKLDLSVLAY